MSKKPKKKYDWPPPPEPYVPRQRNSIHSVLTALPVIMLVAGLYFYYSAESEQTQSQPIRAHTVELSGVFTGLSKVKSGQQGRHYLWVQNTGKARGIRVRPEYSDILDTMARGELVNLKVAPTVPGSNIYWAWYVEQTGTIYLNDEASLQ